MNILTGRAAVFATARLAGIQLLDGTQDPIHTLARAGGLASTGARVAVWLQGRQAGLVTEQVLDLVARNIPMVIHLVVGPYPDHAGGTDHALYHRLADSGAFSALSRNPTDAANLTLLAHQVAERGLLPCILAHDGPETAFAPTTTTLPDAAFCRNFLHDHPEESATPAQELLFGKNRARVPAWFDPDRPTATGWSRESGDLAVASAGFRLFFADAMESTLMEALAESAMSGGASLEPILAGPGSGHRFIVVAQGAAADAAENAAVILRKRHGWNVGVVKITWLRPFPTQRLRALLSMAKAVTVLERLGVSTGPGPLRREVLPCMPPDCVPISAIWDPARNLRLQDMAAVFKNTTVGARARVFPGIPPWVPDSPHFPKREAAHQALIREYPDLGQVTLPEMEPLDAVPSQAVRLAVFATRTQLTDERIDETARLLAEEAGSHLTSTLRPAGSGSLALVLTASPLPCPNPTAGAPVACALVGSTDIPLNPFKRVKPGGNLIFATSYDPADFPAVLPPAWLASLREGAHTCRLYSGPVEDFPKIAVSAVTGKFDDLPLLVSPDKVRHPVPIGGEPLPHQRKLPLAERTYDNLPRFWGEILQPTLAGRSLPTLEPLSALGRVPAGSAAITNRARTRDYDIRFDPSKCTGCGACWISCPDSAIHTAALPAKVLIEASVDAVRDQFPQATADRLKRLAGRIAPKWEALLAEHQVGIVRQDLLDEAYRHVISRIEPDGGEELDWTWSAARDHLISLAAAATDTLFHQLHRNHKGDGSLLFLSVNTARCQGCGICTRVCEPDALTREERDLSRISSDMERQHHFEKLPDTPGQTLAKLNKADRLNPLAVAFLSRYCAQALPGGTAEPGSAAGLALRLTCGMAEFVGQRHMIAYAQDLNDLAGKLRQKLLDKVTETLSGNDPQALETLLGELPPGRASMETISAKLNAMGAVAGLDVESAGRLASLGRELGERHELITTGHSGNGRSRYGLVLAAKQTRDLSHYPFNAFNVPVISDHSGNGTAKALGLAEGILQKHAAEMRRVRLAETALRRGITLAEHKVPARLAWDDLTRAERARCPRVILVVDESALRAGRLETVLSADFPLTVLVLDGKADPADEHDALSLALAYPDTPVFASSMAAPAHLASALEKALTAEGPAVVHLYIPHAQTDGFATEHLLDVVRAATRVGVQPLFRYDPQADEHFGPCLHVDEAPEDPLSEWTKLLSRFKDTDEIVLGRGAEARDKRRRLLLELAGKQSPFSDSIRQALTREFEADYQKRLDDLEGRFQKEQMDAERRRREELSVQLSERLFTLVKQSEEKPL
ncbi:MAG: 4Fe-4S binding protein [Acidobacteriota bacterium]|nr:4Fe-4S binding protein [Acidobacteriota bacterium]